MVNKYSWIDNHVLEKKHGIRKKEMNRKKTIFDKMLLDKFRKQYL